METFYVFDDEGNFIAAAENLRDAEFLTRLLETRGLTPGFYHKRLVETLREKWERGELTWRDP